MFRIRLDLENAATVYVSELLFSRWFCLPVEWVHEPCASIKVERIGISGKELSFAGVSLDAQSISNRVLRQIFEGHRDFSAKTGTTLWQVFGEQAWLNQSVFSVIFYLVSGVAEVKSLERDNHNRFPASSSPLSTYGLLEYPVADILAEYVLDLLRTNYGILVNMARNYEVTPTHDVDAPYKYAFRSSVDFLRGITGDIIRCRDIKSIWRSPLLWAKARGGNVRGDPFNCFDRIMRLDERRGLMGTFFFISGKTGGRIDGDYKIKAELIRSLIREIGMRGHRIGLHPSYNAPFSLKSLVAERRALQEVCSAEGYQYPIEFVRTHYLRFDPALTPSLLDQAGFKQDSSLGFADYAGFRRGTSRPFPLWDHASGQALGIVEQPLIAMECSLLAGRYEGLTREEAAAKLNRLKAECKRFGGKFVLLWHNNYFASEEDFELYDYAIS